MKKGTERKLLLVIGASGITLLVLAFFALLFKTNKTSLNIENIGKYIKAGVNNNACSNCDIVISSNQNNLNVPAGRVVCILPGVKISGNLNVGEKAILCNQGEIDVSNANIGEGATIYNSGEFEVHNSLTLGARVSFYNYGEFEVEGDLNLNPGALVENSGTVEVEGNLNINDGSTFTNNGSIEVENTINVNSNGILNNNGEIETENMNVNGTVNNTGTINVEDDLTINSGGSIITPNGASKTGCINVEGRSIVNGCLGCNNLPLGFCDQSSSNGGQPDIVNASATIGNAISYCQPGVCGAPLQRGIQLSVKYTNNELIFNWTNIPQALAYNIEYDLSPAFNSPVLLNSFAPGETQYKTSKKADMNNTVYFRIIAMTEDGKQVTSNTIELNFEKILKAEVKFGYKDGTLRFNKCLKSLQILDLSGKVVYNSNDICEQVNNIQLEKSTIYIFKYVDEAGNSGYKKIQF